MEAAGGSMTDVVKTMVYMTDIADFGAVNEVYAEFYSENLPSRGGIEAAALPKGALIAVEAVAGVDRTE